ncbi:MAG TPA: hypothetical protein VGS58_22000 [Candidatus Sulfopaludibacter sp.]|nr:hypothetical protein [Candidatus Sulfopaludibacter sp.]
MTITPRNQPHIPPLQIDLDEILGTITLELARVHGCAQCRRTLSPLIDNITQLAGEITRLHEALIAERLTSANLLAAIRAALGAAADGEADPLAYLREELPDSRGAHGA